MNEGYNWKFCVMEKLGGVMSPLRAEGTVAVNGGNEKIYISAIRAIVMISTSWIRGFPVLE